MSVWPEFEAASSALSGSEGALVSVSIEVKPRYLESLLEALAQLPFPINPEIYHDAAIVSRDVGGQERTQDVTLVEFPAYEGRLDVVRRVLEAYGFGLSSLHVTSMLEEIRSENGEHPAETSRRLVRRPRSSEGRLA